MSGTSPSAHHLDRPAVVYVRQSTLAQVRNNTESLERQYELVERAVALGWAPEQVRVIDGDLGLSGAETGDREGFKALVADVALGSVGIVVGIEVSRLARNNAAWYQLLDLCALGGTLIADSDGVYDPTDYSDRLVLGLKGTISEAELQLLRGRLLAGIRHKAAKGELRLMLPAGLEYSPDSSIVLSPDESERAAINEVFRRFDEYGSVRQTTLSLIGDGLSLPRRRAGGRIEWRPAGYEQVHSILMNPTYAGVFAYGRTRIERGGPVRGRKRQLRNLDPEDWAVLIEGHHPSYLSFEKYRENVARLTANGPVLRGEAGKALREGSALLQGLVRCGRCGHMMHIMYRLSKRNGDKARYVCQPKSSMVGTGTFCQGMIASKLDEPVVSEVLRVLEPAALAATTAAIAAVEADGASRLSVFETAVERARFAAERARRQYDAIEPENRLVARSLEAAWEERLVALHQAEAALDAQRQRRPAELSRDELAWLSSAGADLAAVFSAPTTTNRDRKALLRALIAEVGLSTDIETRKAEVVIAWRGGEQTKLTVPMQKPGASYVVGLEQTVELVRRLATLYDDTMIATVLGRQNRRTATGLRFTRQHVADLRRANDIPALARATDTPQEQNGDVVSVSTVASELGVSPETIYRWLASGFIAGEQLTGGAPWRIRLDDALRAKVTEVAPEGWLPLAEAARALGVARQTVLHKVQRGELRAVHVRKGRRSGLRIQVERNQLGLFDEPDGEVVQC